LKHSECLGITVIELLVVISTITLLLAVGVPKVEDFAIRARVSEGLAIASAAKQAMLETCASTPSAKIHQPRDTNFNFRPSKYVSELIMSADCARQILWVGVVTRNTGAYSDPFFIFIVVHTRNNGQANWKCKLLRGEPEHVPSDCRSKGV
jgi:type IV pilus assembly protein PilA